MKNPYEILNIPSNASIEQVRTAYKNLAAKYHPDNYIGSPMADEAKRKMQEIDEAYDMIIMSRGTQGKGSTEYSNEYSYQSSDSARTDFYDIRNMINSGRIDDAEMRLDGISNNNRNAEWYFLKGSINNRRGWLDEAKRNFSIACQMDPSNNEYKAAFDALNNNYRSNGGYRTQYRERQNKNSDCFGGDKTTCDICSSLLCADCCCECMGGDLIPCC